MVSYVFGVAFEDYSSNATLADFENKIGSLEEKGYTMPRLENELDNYKELIRLNQTQKMNESYQNLDNLISQAIYLDGLISKISITLPRINGNEFEIGNISMNYNLGINEFKVNNFESAKGYLEKSYEGINMIMEQEGDSLIDSLVLSLNDSSAGLDGYYESVNLSVFEMINEINQEKADKDYNNIFIIRSNLDDFRLSVSLFSELINQTANIDSSGFPADRIKDSLIQSEDMLRKRDYKAFLSEVNNTLGLIPKIYSINSSIYGTEQKIMDLKKSSIDAREAEELLNSSIKEFNFQNYEKSQEYLDKTDSLITELEQKYLLNTFFMKANSRFNLLDFLKKNWLTIILVVSATYILARSGISYLKLVLFRNRLKSLYDEKKASKGMIKKLEIQYFKAISIDKESYLAQREKYEGRLDELIQEIPALEKKISEKEQYFDNMKKRFRMQRAKESGKLRNQ
jgi:hypothetical protein